MNATNAHGPLEADFSSILTCEDLYEEFLLEEGLVRARLSDAQINQLALELKLDLSLEESWVTLEAMTMW